MSFKRDGNDPGLLSILQKRRIKDLLAESIPEDEAKLLANGRFTCLVCSSHPIFDTVNMLTVHRNGKKHKASEEFHKKKKEELKQLIAKRRHDQFLRNGSTTINVATSQHSGISTLSPYDSRVKRSKMKSGARKPCINLQSLNGSSDAISKEEEGDVPQYSTTPWQRICEQQLQEGPVKHESQLKNIFRHKITEPPRLRPYAPKHRNSDQSDGNNSTTYPLKVGPGQGTAAIATHENRSSSSFQPSSHTTAPQLLPPPPPENVPLPPPSVPSQSKQHKSDSSGDQRPQETQDQKTLALKYFQLQGSGWKRDWDGKWIKDEQAEFDSDEEPPDLP